ncbi:MAG TPA: NADH-quinone oxidoreductase subunit J [Actinomycetota bacterium]|nr:NADH-quinone oxidoreductase subunit J [Actinomycetota bacterium]
MNLEVVVFGVMFVLALGCSIAMLFAPNAVHVALFLVGAQMALALAFLLQGAFFVAAIQVIVYAGAIMVLFLFVIMLLGIDLREALVEPLSGQRGVALLLGLLLAVGLVFVAIEGVQLAAGGADGAEALTDLNRDPGNVLALARSLFSKYLLPFEVTSVLLVVAIVGVMVLARRLTAVELDRPFFAQMRSETDHERAKNEESDAKEGVA